MTIVRGVGSEAGRAARLEALQGEVREAQALLDGPASALASADLEQQAIDRAWNTLSGASEELVALLALCGIETPLGWRLHDLRSRLDAHLLAADALRDADVPEAAVSILYRTVDFVGNELETLFADA
jgi:hypothetical protein